MQVANKRMVVITILIFILAVANIVNYFNDDKQTVLIKPRKISIMPKIEQSKYKTDTFYNTKVTDIKNKKIANKSEKIITYKDKVQPDRQEYTDYDDPKSLNKTIDFIEPTIVVNITSEYDKDVLKQLAEYEETKR